LFLCFHIEKFHKFHAILRIVASLGVFNIKKTLDMVFQFLVYSVLYCIVTFRSFLEASGGMTLSGTC
jgi:hypothetical protein